MTHLRRLTLQVLALAVFALGLIWMSGSGVALQTSSAEADNVYNKLHSDLGNIGRVIFADTVNIDAEEQPGVLQSHQEAEDAPETLFKNIKLFNSMAFYIKNRYMEEIDPKELIHAGIRGMLQNLDPFSVLMEQKSYDQLMESTHGKYEGLGMQIDNRDDRIRIISPIEGTPAYRQGLQAGDVIWEINGTSTYQMNTQEAANLMRGPAGTIVNLKIKRQGVPDLLDYDVERAIIELKSVNYYGYLDGTNVGYVRLSRFAEETSRELKDALTDLNSQKKLEGLIFDLRSNGGGLLQEAVETANLFLPKDKLIVYTQGRTPDTKRSYFSTEDALYPEGKLVVLVDEGTASASEIVSGAIQDWDRGVIVGQQTYGKGLVQQIFPSTDDETVALKLTTAKYYIPSGRCIQKPERSKKHPVLDEEAPIEDTTEGEQPADTMKQTEKEIFHTDGGRTVYGGGGIIPDVELTHEKWYPIEMNLDRQQIFFDFAVKYSSEHPNIDRSFEATDDVLEQFQAFMAEKKFDYKTALEVSLDEMKDVVKDENKEQLFSESLDKLGTLVTQEKETDFDRSKEYIKRAIKRELMAKLYGQRGLYEEIVLKTDPSIKRALEVLKDDQEYSKIIREGRSDKAEL